ncbi:hypothetical protein [Novosphingobium sp. SG707]|uniref:hypothetical protein n=1 Tax=Novosphingobium sp. SG707 TaxID=2586996 RepID=UPI001446FE25|nr:hypothetical protein [Novosphingobium sp. SG707]NKI99618.1 hypothetical protein [Novosphingobium sp. SG707]
MTPLCSNCRWLAVTTGRDLRPAWCSRPIGTSSTRAFGEVILRAHRNPIRERKRDKSLILRVEQCGPDARFFEPRPPMPPPSRGK